MTASEDLADRFHAAMLSGDTEILNSILSDDVTFTGPMASSSGRDDTVAGIVQMSKMTKGDEVLVRLTDDQNALIWSEITTSEGPATPAATWLEIAGDRITSIRTVFSAGR
ncbi:nuclear transport factor 2 family protein [Nocardioides sp. GXZ039]|uniref:nuclear transport factor 2 family protein n=1 Tax=Nocardioides sp. GXZ039 TaxID=3136018 RepID=UPI0030F374A3